jgi:hypothetical protein
MNNEQWRDVLGYEQTYQVSDQGNVRRKVAMGGRSGTRYPAYGQLRPHKNCEGYLTVNLFKDGCGKSFLVHRLVALAFIGEIPEGYEVNHLSGVRCDNRLCNLEVVTHLQNVRHSLEVLGSPRLRTPKLTEVNVVEIRRLLASGLKHKVIAEQFNVVERTISALATGQTWSHIPKEAE